MKTVWTIAGSDSGGGAGIQADLLTFHDFGVHGCSAITALTAQNTQGVLHIQGASPENLSAQLEALKADLPADAIKLGMLYDPDLITLIAQTLSSLNVPIIADPVLISTSQASLSKKNLIEVYRSTIMPLASLITPNIHEAQALSGLPVHSTADMEAAAHRLLELGAKAVLIKGGDLGQSELSSDYYADLRSNFWINLPRIHSVHTHGTGCTLSAAIAASLAQGWPLHDALILAKAYVHAGLTQAKTVGQGHHPIGHINLYSLKNHFPWVTQQPQALLPPSKTLIRPIGPYPLVDNLEDLALLCSKGISTIQLRIKNPPEHFEAICEKAAELCKNFGVDLIINDHMVGDLGLHLGQEDLARLFKKNKGIFGISSHNLFELAKAYAYHPSYLAMGPIFETESKTLNYPPVGLDKLKLMASLSPLPLVAIGGIEYEKIPEILALGCSGVAFIKAAKRLKEEGRYDRHLRLPGFNLQSQQALAQAKVLCIGTGGLAAGFLPYLAAAGVGSLTLIDHDRVNYSNLQRQVLFRESDLYRPKAQAAAEYLRGLNSTIKITALVDKFTPVQAIDLMQSHDLVIDGTDNFNSHYLINDTARLLNLPLIAASVFQDQGQLFYFAPESACYRCLFPQAPSLEERPNCNIAGVLGTTPALLGVMQAQTAIEVLRQAQNQSFCRTVQMNNGLTKSFQITKDPACPICHSPSPHTLRSLHMSTPIENMSVENLKALIDAGIEVPLLDVREQDEREDFNIGGQHIPIQDLPERINELDQSVEYVVYCAAGGRSAMACEFLTKYGFKVRNLTGGMKAWLAD